MSRIGMYFFIAVIALSTATVSRASDWSTGKTPKTVKWADAEKNYLKALASENDGVRMSAAEFLGRYQMKGGIGALIATLKTDKVEQVRSAAAFALILMNEDEGVKAVEESSLYDGSDKVAAFCATLLNFQNVRSFIAVSE